MQGQGNMKKALGAIVMAGLFLDAAVAKADQATYLKDEASYCEIFQAINPDVPDHCYEELGLSPEGGLTRGLKTRGIQLHTPSKVVQSASQGAAQAAHEPEDYSIAMRVPFHFDSDELTVEAKSILDRVAQVLNSELMIQNGIQIAGHADASGPEVYNLSLSTRRALAVQAYLVDEHMVAVDRLYATGMGETEPYDAANPYAGINRRVEFTNLGG